jgi:hypothetical protein
MSGGGGKNQNFTPKLQNKNKKINIRNCKKSQPCSSPPTPRSPYLTFKKVNKIKTKQREGQMQSLALV